MVQVIGRMCSPALIALGSNAGNVSVLQQARDRLAALGTIESSSRVYQTHARGSAAAQPFYNAAVFLHTELPPVELKSQLKRIEVALGRRRRRGEVAIDLDLCLYGSEILDDPACRLPHPLLLSRSYMIVPVAECDPHFLHPETGEELGQIADRVRRTDTSVIELTDVRL
jgi:2-amino-4-hydroxy-6-hydroxymethyldihydropteridine diphosphokinase